MIGLEKRRAVNARNGRWKRLRARHKQRAKSEKLTRLRGRSRSRSRRPAPARGCPALPRPIASPRKLSPSGFPHFPAEQRIRGKGRGGAAAGRKGAARARPCEQKTNRPRKKYHPIARRARKSIALLSTTACLSALLSLPLFLHPVCEAAPLPPAGTKGGLVFTG